MKNVIKLIGIIAFTVIIAFTLTAAGCDNGTTGGGGSKDKDKDTTGDPVKQSDFYGKWVRDNGNYYTISSNEITLTVLSGNMTESGYATWSINTVTPETNTGSLKTDYPSGFQFAGKVTSINIAGNGKWSMSSGIIQNVGDDCSTTLYMHTNKRSITPGNFPYTKR
jgi:hypothetical protein